MSIKDFEKLIKAKGSIIDTANIELSALVQDVQKELNNLFLAEANNFAYKNGELVFSGGNVAKLNRLIKKLTEAYGELIIPILEQVVNSLPKIDEAAAKLFTEQGINDLPLNVLDKLNSKLGVTSEGIAQNGYLGNILYSTDPLIKLKSEAIKAIARQVPQQEFIQSITNRITGGGATKGYGILEQHYAATEMSDLYNQYERQYSNELAEVVKFDKARYSGPLMSTTRPWCRTHVGKILTRKQIEAWSTKTWKGKNKFYNPIADAGGHNCNHTWDWISDELAEEWGFSES